ncbi:putative T7SS-secreted protein [Georgenia faecalis]|uniref:T7SS-secreted protein n=1 Tax=Georgenia faecalis TaxID=2483799 RepID=A0ABV9DBA9_9MICO|nr:hypothetical protein [Georgenia faecalis]
MSAFVIDGDPGAVRARAAVMAEKGTGFQAVADSLETVTTGGWTGRASDRFRDRFDAEPHRWREAGDGWVRAARALETYADALARAQERAAWCASEHDRGEEVTSEARSAYDNDVTQARREVAAARASGELVNLTILPFSDPGQAVRSGARAEFAAAKADLKAAAGVCAHEVRRGCDAAPPERNWFESGLRFVGGVLAGAGEALWELGEMVVNLSLRPVFDLVDLATGNLTPEELAARNRMSIEQATAMLGALRDDPLAFGTEVGKAMLDWDTWADDPARALGRLIPDLVATVASGGAGASVRAVRGLDALHDLSLLDRPLHGLRTLSPDGVDLQTLTGLDRLDDGALLRHVNGLSPDDQARLLRRGADWDSQSMADVFGPHRFDTDYTRPDVAGSWLTGPRVDADTIPVDRPLANLHNSDAAGSGSYWTDLPEMLRMRSEDNALDRLALRDEWYMTGPESGYTYAARDEITVRAFHGGEDMRMQVGALGPQRADAPAWDGAGHDLPLPTHRPDGTPIPVERPGGAQQYVAGLDRPAYDTPVESWTGPAPWAQVVPDGVWGGFGAGALLGGGGSLAAGAAADTTAGGR